MRIELTDIDVPYEVSTDITAEGKDIIRIIPQSANKTRDEEYDICLDKDGAKQLIRTLQFLVSEL